MSRISLAVLLCVLAAANAFAGFSQTQDFRPATPEELAMKDVDYAPGAAAVILDWVEVDDDTQSVSSEYYRIKVLTDEGKKYADVEVPYIAGYPVQRPRDRHLRAHDPARRHDRAVRRQGLRQDPVQRRRRCVCVRRPSAFPRVQAGSILEYRYQRRWATMMLMNTLWSIQRDIPVLHARMSLKPYDSNGEYASFFTYLNLPPGKVPAEGQDATIYELDLTNVPALSGRGVCAARGVAEDAGELLLHDQPRRPGEVLGRAGRGVEQEHRGLHRQAGSAARARAAARRQGADGDAAERLREGADVQEPQLRGRADARTTRRTPRDVVAKAEGYRARDHPRVRRARARGRTRGQRRARRAARPLLLLAQRSGRRADGRRDRVGRRSRARPTTSIPGTPTAPFGIVSWEKSSVPGFRIAKGAAANIETVAEQKPENAVRRRSADLRLNGDVLEGIGHRDVHRTGSAAPPPPHVG